MIPPSHTPRFSQISPLSARLLFERVEVDALHIVLQQVRTLLRGIVDASRSCTAALIIAAGGDAFEQLRLERRAPPARSAMRLMPLAAG